MSISGSGDPVSRGRDVTITCSVNRGITPTAGVNWIRNTGSVSIRVGSGYNLLAGLDLNSRYRMSQDSNERFMLDISDARYEDSGEYECQLDYQGAGESQSVKLIVCDDPGSDSCKCQHKRGWADPGCFEEPEDAEKTISEYRGAVIGLVICLVIVIVYGVVITVYLYRDVLRTLKLRAEKKLEQRRREKERAQHDDTHTLDLTDNASMLSGAQLESVARRGYAAEARQYEQRHTSPGGAYAGATRSYTSLIQGQANAGYESDAGSPHYDQLPANQRPVSTRQLHSPRSAPYSRQNSAHFTNAPFTTSQSSVITHHAPPPGHRGTSGGYPPHPDMNRSRSDDHHHGNRPGNAPYPGYHPSNAPYPGNHPKTAPYPGNHSNNTHYPGNHPNNSYSHGNQKTVNQQNQQRSPRGNGPPTNPHQAQGRPNHHQQNPPQPNTQQGPASPKPFGPESGVRPKNSPPGRSAFAAVQKDTRSQPNTPRGADASITGDDSMLTTPPTYAPASRPSQYATYDGGLHQAGAGSGPQGAGPTPRGVPSPTQNSQSEQRVRKQQQPEMRGVHTDPRRAVAPHGKQNGDLKAVKQLQYGSNNNQTGHDSHNHSHNTSHNQSGYQLNEMDGNQQSADSSKLQLVNGQAAQVGEGGGAFVSQHDTVI